jgi:predicted RNase H-like nuclease (RuvC/YqgF family)
VHTKSPCHRQHSNEIRSNGFSPWDPAAHIYKKKDKKKKKNRKGTSDLLGDIKALKKQIKTLQSKVLFLHDKNRDLKYFLDQKELELQRVREEMAGLKS